MAKVRLKIRAMSCEHCVSAVSAALRELPGVSQVTVSLESGTAEVVTTAPVPADHFRAAVEEAGYELVSTVEEADRG
jgi:copper ion binding protein